jgi:hypothetical protein
MTANVLVSKNEEKETAIPSVWREVFSSVVEAFIEGDFKLERGIVGVRKLTSEDAIRIASNIKSYGAQLVSLPEQTWETSVCQWMRSYWDVLVDLYTVEEGASDLVLVVRVYQENSSYAFEIHSVHVP